MLMEKVVHALPSQLMIVQSSIRLPRASLFQERHRKASYTTLPTSFSKSRCSPLPFCYPENEVCSYLAVYWFGSSAMVTVTDAEEITVQSELHLMAYSKFLLPCRTWLAELTDNLSREDQGKEVELLGPVKLCWFSVRWAVVKGHSCNASWKN